MHQYQIVVESDGHSVFTTNWVTGRESAEPLAMLIASRFPEDTYRVTVAHRRVDMAGVPWGEFVVAGEPA